MAYIQENVASGATVYALGGKAVVTDKLFDLEKKSYDVKRLAGKSRFETSVMVAETFFSKPTTAVLAYGYNFPDGLCAGPLAATINAPLILTATGDEAQAAAYAKEEGIKDGYVLGGSALISDKAVKKIFSMSSGDKIK